MKHKLSIILTILIIFLLTQFIGLAVINSYTNTPLPYGMQPSADINNSQGFISIIISFAIAIGLIFLLMKYKWKAVIRIWFFIVITLALSISINALLKNYFSFSTILASLIALPLAYLKLFKPNVISHNLTEILIYPGLSVVFIPILGIWSIIILLILISIYDMWMVWKTGLMQKMAKFQMNELKIFGGLLIPYMSKRVKQQIANLKKSKSKKDKNKKIKIQTAILGGGDIVFPLITAGIFLRTFGLIPALFVVAGAFAGLLFLFTISQPKKSYPAMPYITAGMFVAMILAYLIL